MHNALVAVCSSAPWQSLHSVNTLLTAFQCDELQVERLPVFWKQQRLMFFDAFSFAFPAALQRIPYSLLVSLIWTVVTYWAVGLAGQPSRCFLPFLAFCRFPSCSFLSLLCLLPSVPFLLVPLFAFQWVFVSVPFLFVPFCSCPVCSLLFSFSSVICCPFPFWSISLLLLSPVCCLFLLSSLPLCPSFPSVSLCIPFLVSLSASFPFSVCSLCSLLLLNWGWGWVFCNFCAVTCHAVLGLATFIHSQVFVQLTVYLKRFQLWEVPHK